MYVGRIVSVACTLQGNAVAMYRVSSRSFPNRRSVISDDKVSIVPQVGFEDDLSKNPYISYNCLLLANDYAIVSNGSHTDPIAEKLLAGLPPKEALSMVLLTLDYEHDSLDTPRIAALVSKDASSAWLGIVRKDALLVKECKLEPGKAFYLCTYEKNEPGIEQSAEAFTVDNAENACNYIMKEGIFADFERPISAAAAYCKDNKFEIAIS
jgi:IMP cyclohydrolase